MKRLLFLVCFILMSMVAQGACLGSSERLFLKNLVKRKVPNHYKFQLKGSRVYIKEKNLISGPTLRP